MADPADMLAGLSAYVASLKAEIDRLRASSSAGRLEAENASLRGEVESLRRSLAAAVSSGPSCDRWRCARCGVVWGLGDIGGLKEWPAGHSALASNPPRRAQ
jgi:hypothetical protein